MFGCFQRRQRKVIDGPIVGGRGDVKSTLRESIALSANGRPTLPPPKIQIHRSNNNHTIINNRTTSIINLPEAFFLVFGLVLLYRGMVGYRSSMGSSCPATCQRLLGNRTIGLSRSCLGRRRYRFLATFAAPHYQTIIILTPTATALLPRPLYLVCLDST